MGVGSIAFPEAPEGIYVGTVAKEDIAESIL